VKGNVQTNLIDLIGGVEIIEKIHHHFYDILFNDSKLKYYFAGKDKALLTSQQTRFMSGLLGAAKNYGGLTPKFAHKHMVISDELYSYRQELLKKSILHYGVSEEVTDKWISVDEKFRNVVVKTRNEAVMRYPKEGIIDFT